MGLVGQGSCFACGEAAGSDGGAEIVAVCVGVRDGGDERVEAGEFHVNGDRGIERVFELEADGDGGDQCETDEGADVLDVEAEGERGERGVGEAVYAALGDVVELDADGGVGGDLTTLEHSSSQGEDAALTTRFIP